MTPFLFSFSFSLSFSLSLSLSSLCEASRPTLVSSSVWYTNTSVVAGSFELGVVRMEFDEEVYVTGWGFLCAAADSQCTSLSCDACDWSSQPYQQVHPSLSFLSPVRLSDCVVRQAANCTDVMRPSCCGLPSNSLDFSQWCTPPIPYETLQLEVPSPFSLSNIAVFLFLCARSGPTPSLWAKHSIFVSSFQRNSTVTRSLSSFAHTTGLRLSFCPLAPLTLTSPATGGFRFPSPHLFFPFVLSSCVF